MKIKTKIIYSSVGGNTELVVKYIAKKLNALNFVVDIKRASTATIWDLDGQIIIFACPTYNHGELEHYFRKFLDSTDGYRFEKNNLYVVIALGDPIYDKGNLLKSAKMLEDWVRSKNLNLYKNTLRIVGNPVFVLDKIIEPWLDSLVKFVFAHELK